MKTPSPQRLGRNAITQWGTEEVRAYIPPHLPLVPPVEIEGLQALLAEANCRREA